MMREIRFKDENDYLFRETKLPKEYKDGKTLRRERRKKERKIK